VLRDVAEPAALSESIVDTRIVAERLAAKTAKAEQRAVE
jgi:hypothetical protein